MTFFSWFSKAAPPDYETLLARLATDINDAKVHLSEIRLRERRLSLLVNLYGIGAWAVWVGLWWVRGLPFGLLGWTAGGVESRIVGITGIAGGPIFIVLLNRLLHFYFTRQRIAEETHLRKLLGEQRKQLEDIKKATNYDSTRKLIEQYDQFGGPLQPLGQPTGSPRASAPSTPAKQKKGSSPSSAVKTPQGTPTAPGHLMEFARTPVPTAGQGGAAVMSPDVTSEQAAALHLHMQAIQPVLPPPEKKWYDRVVDSILGDDPSQATHSKYALVCGECFRHNGLVGSKYEWERMQWICPRCNHMNPAPLTRSKAESSTNSPAIPSMPASPSPSSPSQPSQLPRAAPRPRRILADKGTPKSSRLGQEVFTADEEGGEGQDLMDVDEK